MTPRSGRAFVPPVPASAESGPVRLRRFLIHLGPVFVKVGQHLALRPDILPQEYCDSLLDLSDHVPPFPFEQARKIIKDELGKEPEELFTWINPQPVAAGSLAQVHEATLADETRVSVKIQRPGIRAQVEKDLRRADRIARLLKITGAAEVISATDLVHELRRWMLDELDFRRELANMQRLRELSGDSPRMFIPAAYPELSSASIVTSGFVTGVPFSELLGYISREGPERIGELGFERERLAENLLWSVLDQIFRLEFFHADPHPGNLIALPDNVVAFVDFGLVETLAPTIRQKQLDYLSALYSNDTDGIHRALLEVLEITSESDLEGFRRDFLALTRAWFRDKDLPPDFNADRWPLSDYMAGMMRAARVNRLRVPVEVLALYRSLLTAETVAHRLGGKSDLRAVGSEFFKSIRTMEMMRLLDPRAYQSVLMDVLSLVKSGPGNLNRVLSSLADDRLTLQVKVLEQRDDQRMANVRAQLLATSLLFLGIAALIMAGGQGVVFGPVRVVHVLGAAEIGLIGLIAMLWRKIS